MKAKPKETNLNNSKYRQVIENKKSVESYFKSKYNVPYLNWKTINNIE